MFTVPAIQEGVVYNTVCGDTKPPPFAVPTWQAGKVHSVILIRMVKLFKNVTQNLIDIKIKA